MQCSILGHDDKQHNKSSVADVLDVMNAPCAKVAEKLVEVGFARLLLDLYWVG